VLTLKCIRKHSLILQPHTCLNIDNNSDLKDPGFDNVQSGKGYCTETDVYADTQE
jgi:hypothetical protein